MLTYPLAYLTLIFLPLFYHTAWIPPAIEPTYGAPISIGPAREPCVTEVEAPQAIILTPQSAWEQLLQEGAQPGAIFLLRGGLYAASDKLWLKAGTADAPITIQPYNCEPVLLQTSLRPNSYNIIAGLQIEASGIDDQQWAVRLDGKNEGALSHIVIRNNTIIGGNTDALRVSGDVKAVEISGNHIDGGRDGHNIFVTAEGVANLPTAITISQNLLTKAHFTTPSEDMLQVRDVGLITFTYNTCTNGYNMEQCVDIKRTTQPLLIANNLFDGSQLHLAGTGEDQAGGCMVIHEEDELADSQRIEYNFFRHCKNSQIRFGTGSTPSTSSALVRYNLFWQSPAERSTVILERATATTFLNNTFVYGTLKLGNSDQSRIPQATVLKNNIFYHTAIEDNTTAWLRMSHSSTPAVSASISLTTMPYQCHYNLLYQLEGSFASGGCQSSVEAEPHFVSVTDGDFRLQADSPAIGRGENGVDIGARSALLPTAALTVRGYLPLIFTD